MTSVRPELSVKIYTPRLLPSSALQVQWSDDDTAALSNLRQILKALLALQSQLIRDESALSVPFSALIIIRRRRTVLNTATILAVSLSWTPSDTPWAGSQGRC